MRRVLNPPRIAWLLAIVVAGCLKVPAALAQGHGGKHGNIPEPVRLMWSGRRATYEGKQKVTIHMRGRDHTADAIVKQYHGWLRTEIVLPLPHKGPVILERGDRRLVRRADGCWQARPASPPPPPFRMLRNYCAQQVGTATIAGRATMVVEIKAKAGGMVARKIWLDTQTGVALRTEHYNWAGQPVYESEFNEITYAPAYTPDEDDFRAPAAAPEEGSRVMADTEAAAYPKPAYLPAGYTQDGKIRAMQTRRGTAAHIRYSDGLRSLSVFIRKLNPGDDPQGRRQPPMDPLGGVAHAVKDGYSVTVMGDLDPKELSKIAGSVSAP